MNRYRIAVAMFLWVFLGGACVSGGAGGSAVEVGASGVAAGAASGGGGAEGGGRRLTLGEIEGAGLPNAYELVARLRRAWLRRDGLTGAEVVVYMDEQAIGGAEVLRGIASVEVAELRYLTREEALRRWGSVVEGGVIVVVRR